MWDWFSYSNQKRMLEAISKTLMVEIFFCGTLLEDILNP